MEKQVNANATNATLTAEQLAALPPEIAAMMAAMQQQLAETQAALLAAQTRKTRAPKQPKDIWSNSSLLIDGNDHARLLVTLAVMTRDGASEETITQCDWVRHCMALSIALGAYKATATQGIAEASTRTAAGQLRRAREVLDLAKLQDKVKAVKLGGFEKAMYDYYKDRDLFGGAKEDSDKRWSRQRCELLRANWRDNWTADNDWRPTDDGTLPLFIDPEPDNDGEI
jgi:hypothetical protein